MKQKVKQDEHRVRVAVETPVISSPRLMQVAAMFDVPIAEKSRLEWDLRLPLTEQDWNVGLIVGPSGSGKTSIARHLWPEQVAAAPAWSAGAAIVDDFPAQASVREVTGLLCAVGLSSPPAWLRPHHTLSNGEQFRADMARLLADTDAEQITVVDEFTSVVDRQVAQVASHALQKTIRRGGRQFVAVSCHYDIAEWLQPDWVLDMASGVFTWRTVQPHPRLELCIAPVDRSAWHMFGRHHYLSGDIHPGAACFGGWINGRLVAFAAYLHFPHPKTKTIKMGHRLVVLPDFQGLGIGGRIDDWLGQHLYERGYRYRNVVSHPAMIAYYSGSPRWRSTTPPARRLATTSKRTGLREAHLNPRRLSTRSFEYAPPISKQGEEA
ncbi:GNAT family N-acetyltransferase [Nonomuraea sp. NPDC050556]|uniref:GNAT family N-acetyltransferase n=1 Tax=Nonomuraea sp. NPDC050556 TaxID=3364369 RepID=UPI0037A82D14